MKKYIIYTLTLSLVIFISSCDKELDLKPISEVSFDSAFDTPEDLENNVAGVYSSLQEPEQYGYYFSFFMEIRSDNTRLEDLTIDAGQFGNFETFLLEASNRRINSTWISMYQTIQRANIVLNRIDGVSGLDNTLKAKRKGEVKFLRALTYFNLVRIWGDVPLILTETEDAFESFNHTRTPLSEVYTQIETDLTEAISELSAPYDYGRVTKEAAQTLLGKVYLTQNKFSEAVTMLQSVIGKYQLEPIFSDVFEVEDNKENIFEIQYKSGGFGEGSSFSNQFAPLGSASELNINGTTSGDNIPTQDLYNAYSSTDVRRDYTIKSIIDGRFYSGKFVEPLASQSDSDKNFIVLRYADVLLMLAEAMNEVSYDATGTGLAYQYLNEVRNRAGLTTPLTNVDLPSQEAFRNAIANERRLELATENHRWFDLVRTGKMVQVMNNHFATEGISATAKEFNNLYPIPQAQIDASGNKLTQNAEY